jgi:hypothetical protein
MAVKYFCDQCGKELPVQDRYNIVLSVFPNLQNRMDLTTTVRNAMLCKSDAEYIVRLLGDVTWAALNERDGVEE